LWLISTGIISSAFINYSNELHQKNVKEEIKEVVEKEMDEIANDPEHKKSFCPYCGKKFE